MCNVSSSGSNAQTQFNYQIVLKYNEGKCDTTIFTLVLIYCAMTQKLKNVAFVIFVLVKDYAEENKFSKVTQ